MIRKLPPVGYLRQCFRYDKRTGKLWWKRRPREHFVDERAFGVWNTRWAGQEAFTSVNGRGYKNGSLDGVGWYAHRIIWKIVTGEQPPDVIDHRDRNRINNCWKNLRAATDGQNIVNKVSSWAKSGEIGVRQLSNGTWNVRVHKDGRCFSIGAFAGKEQAVAARLSFARDLYGDFVP